jgi:hypothetical protein
MKATYCITFPSKVIVIFYGYEVLMLRLPYTEATIMEIQRMGSIAPQVTANFTLQDCNDFEAPLWIMTGQNIRSTLILYFCSSATTVELTIFVVCMP